MPSVSAWDMYQRQKQAEILLLAPIASQPLHPDTIARVMAMQDPPVGCPICYRPTLKRGRLELAGGMAAYLDRWCDQCQRQFTEEDLNDHTD
jgi:transposase-like protein